MAKKTGSAKSLLSDIKSQKKVSDVVNSKGKKVAINYRRMNKVYDMLRTGPRYKVGVDVPKLTPSERKNLELELLEFEKQIVRDKYGWTVV